jgi:glutamate:GABA antiporter
MGTSKAFALSLDVLVCLLVFAVGVRGLRITKWISGTGSLLMVGVFFLMIFLLVRLWAQAKSLPDIAFSLAFPGFSLLTLNVFTKMALFALSGLDQCSIFSEECRKPKNDVARSVFIAAPLMAVLYIASTSSFLAFIPVEKINLAAPAPQLIAAGFGSTGCGWALTALTVGAMSVVMIALSVVEVGMVARLPMAAGWDHLLPAWWSQLHPRFGTPARAIGVVAAATLLSGILSLLGAANQEAVQALAAIGFGSYCLMYILLFGAVVFGFRSTEWRPRIAIRLGAFLALLVSAVALLF